MTQRNRRTMILVFALAILALAVPGAHAAFAESKSLSERQKAYAKAMQARKDKEDAVRALVSQPGDAGLEAARAIAFADHPDPVAVMAIFGGLINRPDSRDDFERILDLYWDMAHQFYHPDAAGSYGAFDMASLGFSGLFYHLHGDQGYVMAAEKVNDPTTSDLDKALYLRVFAQKELRHKDNPYRKLALETYRPYLSTHVSIMLQDMASKVCGKIWDYESIPALEALATPAEGWGITEAFKWAFWMLTAGPDHIDGPDDIVRYARKHGRDYTIYDQARYDAFIKRHDEWRSELSRKQQAERDRKAIEAAKQRAASPPATGEVFARPEPVEGTTAP